MNNHGTGARLAFLNQTAGQILIFSAIFSVIRFLRQSDSRPLVDIVAVAMVGGVAMQWTRVRRGAPVDPIAQQMMWIVSVVAIAAWAGGIWLERNASDHGAWIVVSGAVVAITMGVGQLIRNRVAARSSVPRDNAGAGTTGQRPIQLMTLAALKTTILLLLIELVVVDWLGGLAAGRFGFSEAYFTPITIFLCGAAGYCARQRRSSAAIAGGIIPAAEAVIFAVTGGIPPDVVPAEVRPVMEIIIVLIGFAGGALVGAIGGWLAARRARATGTGLPDAAT